MVVIVWYLDLQLPMQSVHFTTNVIGWNAAHAKVYSIQQCDYFSVTCGRSMGFLGFFGFFNQ